MKISDRAKRCNILGNRLEFHRIQQSLSQEFLGEFLNVPAKRVDEWEKGEKSPSPYYLVQYSDCFRLEREIIVGASIAGQLVSDFDDRFVAYGATQCESGLFALEKWFEWTEGDVLKRSSSPLAWFVRDSRESLGESQSETAQAVGMDERLYTAMESEEYLPLPEELSAVAQHFRASTNGLMDWRDASLLIQDAFDKHLAFVRDVLNIALTLVPSGISHGISREFFDRFAIHLQQEAKQNIEWEDKADTRVTEMYDIETVRLSPTRVLCDMAARFGVPMVEIATRYHVAEFGEAHGQALNLHAALKMACSLL